MPVVSRFRLALLLTVAAGAVVAFHVQEAGGGHDKPSPIRRDAAVAMVTPRPPMPAVPVTPGQPAARPAVSSGAGSSAPALRTAQEFCAQAARRLPNVTLALCEQDQLIDSGSRSVLGRPLWQRDVVARDARRRVLVIGGIHGDELSASALALHWIKDATDAPDGIHWRFVPLMNPDGALRQPPTRVNAHGVDLNRNFPTPDWDTDAPRYWTQRTHRDPRRYPGPRALSEPETQWLVQEMASWKPDLIVSIHAPYGLLDFDGPTVPPQRLGRLYLDQLGIYPGSLGNYGGVHHKVPVVTIELQSALRTPLDPEMRQMWLDLLHWIDERVRVPDTVALNHKAVS